MAEITIEGRRGWRAHLMPPAGPIRGHWSLSHPTQTTHVYGFADTLAKAEADAQAALERMAAGMDAADDYVARQEALPEPANAWGEHARQAAATHYEEY